MKRFFPLIFIGLAVIFFWQFFIKGLLPIPSDTIVGLYHPWRDFYAQEYPNGIPFKNFLITDPIRQQYPWRYSAIDSLKKGSLPLWNPYNFSGYPLLANLQSAVFYPLNIILFFTAFDYGWSFLIFLQPLLAGLFLYFYLKNLNLREEACFLGSLAFSFGGFFTAWLEWNTVLHVALWLPLILLSIDKIFFLNNKENDKINKTIFWGSVFIFSTISSFFAGHLQTFFYLLIISILYITVRLLNYSSRKRKKTFFLFTIFYLLFILVTSVQWFPTLKFILSSAREFDQIIWQKEGWFIPWEHLIQFFVPDFFGNPATLNYWGVWNYAEMIGYIGVLPLIFAVFNLIFRKDKKTLFFGSLFFLSLIFVTPTWFAKLPYVLQIPLISTSQPTRLLFITDFSLAVLASLGFDYFLRLSAEKKNRLFKKTFVTLSLIGLVYGGVWVFILLGNSIVSAENMVVAKRNLILPTLLFISSSVFLIVLLLVKNKIIRNMFIIFILTITIFDLFRFSWKFTPFTKREYLFPETKITKFLQNQQQPFRFMVTDNRIFPPNFSSVYGIQSIDGYDPLYLNNYSRFAAAWIRGKPDISYFSFNRIINIQNYESRFADLLNVKYVLSLDELKSEKLIKVSEEGQIKIYENRNVFLRAFFVEDFIEVSNQQEMIDAMFNNSINLRKTALLYKKDKVVVGENDLGNNETVDLIIYQSDRIKIKTSADSERLLILTDVYYPSWKVYIDGQEEKMHEVDYILRGVVVPQGQHEVLFVNKL